MVFRGGNGGVPLQRTEIVEIVVEGVDLLEKVRQLKVKDDKVIEAVEEMKQAGVKMLRDKEWREVDSIMYKEGVTNFIWSYLHQFFNNSHGFRASLKPLKRPFD